MRYDKRRGFTLIEIMVAMGIILLLVGMLTIGITYVGRSSRERSTKVTLQNARSMFAELDAKTKLRNQPQAWSWRGEDFVPNPADPVHVRCNLNFFTAPYRNDSNTGGFTGDGDGTLEVNDGPDALDAPGVVEKGSPERDCSRAVINTQLVMVQLRGQPSIRSQLEQLPKDQQMTLLWVGGKRPSPGADGVQGTGDEIGGPEDIWYYPGNIVGYDTTGDGVPDATFKCKQTHQATTPPTAAGSAEWDAEADMTTATRSAPLLMDAWENPIIFIPAGGLLVRQNLDRANTTGGPGETALIKSPDNRPFWASAGPDGNFRNADDNIYSFEE